MSCFLDTAAASNGDPPSFDRNGLRLGFGGEWTTEQDSKGLEFRVSKKSGDTLSLVFTGTYIYVAGRIDSNKGMDALFGIDEVGREGGGVLCATTSQTSSSVVFYGVSPLPTGLHTLFITNRGDQLSLSGFQFGPHSGSTTSTSLTSTPSPTLTTTPPRPTPPFSSSNTSLRTVTSLRSTSLNVHTPPPPTIPGPSSNPSQSGSGSAVTTTSAPVNNPPPYSVSTYTTISTLSETTTTLVIGSTDGAQRHLSSHKPSPGTIPDAVVGGIIFFLSLLGLGLWWRRRDGGRVRRLKRMTDPGPEPEMATRLTPCAGEPVRHSGILAISSSNPISSAGARGSFHHDTGLGDGDVQVLPSAFELPIFPSYPEPSSGPDDDARGPDATDGAPSSPQAAISSTDSKPDSTPARALPVAPSPPSPSSDEVVARPPAAAPRSERNVWRVRAQARRLRVEEDGGVRLAGGPLEDVREDDSGEWELLPPPYHHFP